MIKINAMKIDVWRKLLSAVILVIFLPLIASAQMGGRMMDERGMMGDGGMMGPGQGYENPQAPGENPGAAIFSAKCARCHGQSRNFRHSLQALGAASSLKDFSTFLDFIRNPVMPDGSSSSMPSFPPDSISNKQAEALYRYLSD